VLAAVDIRVRLVRGQGREASRGAARGHHDRQAVGIADLREVADAEASLPFRVGAVPRVEHEPDAGVEDGKQVRPVGRGRFVVAGLVRVVSLLDRPLTGLRRGDAVHDLGGGLRLNLVLIPAGEFVIGDANGYADERPMSRARIDRAFWMGRLEVTNEQYALFDPAHDSRLQDGHFLQFSVRERGYPLNLPRQPVVRVSCREAMEFCRWLSRKTGDEFSLPTEAQWEYACRAGTGSPLWYGGIDTDHGKLANLADTSIKPMEKLGWDLPAGAIPPWHPTDGRFDDGARVSADVGSYQPNPWGLYDMTGNVREWTRTVYRPYPYREEAERGNGAGAPLAADDRERRGAGHGGHFGAARRGQDLRQPNSRPGDAVPRLGAGTRQRRGTRRLLLAETGQVPPVSVG
jgi:formylglycine-generating enzyme required for sulfatase activity